MSRIHTDDGGEAGRSMPHAATSSSSNTNTTVVEDATLAYRNKLVGLATGALATTPLSIMIIAHPDTSLAHTFAIVSASAAGVTFMIGAAVFVGLIRINKETITRQPVTQPGVGDVRTFSLPSRFFSQPAPGAVDRDGQPLRALKQAPPGQLQQLEQQQQYTHLAIPTRLLKADAFGNLMVNINRLADYHEAHSSSARQPYRSLTRQHVIAGPSSNSSAAGGPSNVTGAPDSAAGLGLSSSRSDINNGALAAALAADTQPSTDAPVGNTSLTVQSILEGLPSDYSVLSRMGSFWVFLAIVFAAVTVLFLILSQAYNTIV